jgi:diaminohydroxyphosphoribosylaminopyrimidine deaminase / 5-amino-6-(5-phosphoribosylamino)uracil reductase
MACSTRSIILKRQFQAKQIQDSKGRNMNVRHTRTQDEMWMERALNLAHKGKGSVSPNPMVGACVVRNRKLIAEGYHQKFGGPHAEIEAFKRAKGNATRGATLYVTLEPCSTFGKTPPCVEAIVQAKISRVVMGVLDPNPDHSGRAVGILKKHGIRVTPHVLEGSAAKMIEAYAKWIQKRIPFVILKMAQSLDGKIASRTGHSQWITGEEARTWVQGLRASCDAILVGKNTVSQDNPRLTARNGKVLPRVPWRIILDRLGETSPQARVFQGPGNAILACARPALKKVVRKFRNTNVTVFPLQLRAGQLDLRELLSRLGALGITSLLVEGGGEVAWSFLEAGLVDKVEWFVAPKIVGGRQAKTSVEGLGFDSLTQALPIRTDRVIPIGRDILIEGYVEGLCSQESLNGKDD